MLSRMYNTLSDALMIPIKYTFITAFVTEVCHLYFFKF